ncbi:MAG: hypothetical protein KAU94_05060, partial [Verrucomicrobia bacterium]|nr:hypothetical protein [Verrucomicrobiota bacterium]
MMKNHTSKNLLYLVMAGFVLLAVNAWVWMGVQNGQLSPIGNHMLWGAFMVLNMVSLLWAVSLLGLQPLVVACSYAAGGFLAYRGVQGVAGISIAEVTTAGATYGAIGALAVGNVTTKVRMAFFHKGQVPFIFVIVGLLVVDGILNSQISGAGWSVILNALIFPFVFSGVVIGLIWMVVSRFGTAQKSRIQAMPAAEETAIAQSSEESEVDEASQLMIQVPDRIEEEEKPEEIAALATSSDPEPVLKESISMDEPLVEPPASATGELLDATSHESHFFPLEIDKDDEFILPSEESGSMDPSDLLEDASVPSAEPVLDAIPAVDSIALEMEPRLGEPVEQAVPETDPPEFLVEEMVSEPEPPPAPPILDTTPEIE